MDGDGRVVGGMDGLLVGRALSVIECEYRRAALLSAKEGFRECCEVQAEKAWCRWRLVAEACSGKYILRLCEETHSS